MKQAENQTYLAKISWAQKSLFKSAKYNLNEKTLIQIIFL